MMWEKLIQMEKDEMWEDSEKSIGCKEAQRKKKQYSVGSSYAMSFMTSEASPYLKDFTRYGKKSVF